MMARGSTRAWHRDGVTHWDSPNWDQGTHGFNFMAQLYGCTPANGVWVVPGSHKLRKVDIKAMVEEAGSDRLPDAVPIVCKPGDVVITNRQAVHGSFANTSPDWRVTFNFGFHRRRRARVDPRAHIFGLAAGSAAAMLGVRGGGVHNAPAVYDEQRIRARALIRARKHLDGQPDHRPARARVIGYAIDARRGHFPDEAPFVYKPHADSGRSGAGTRKRRRA